LLTQGRGFSPAFGVRQLAAAFSRPACWAFISRARASSLDEGGSKLPQLKALLAVSYTVTIQAAAVGHG